jgi:hypothetical protein
MIGLTLRPAVSDITDSRPSAIDASGTSLPAQAYSGRGSCERTNNLTQRRQGAKTRKQQLTCFLCALCGFAPLRETLLLVPTVFHTFRVVGQFDVEAAESIPILSGRRHSARQLTDKLTATGSN